MWFPKTPPDRNFKWIPRFFELRNGLPDQTMRMTEVGSRSCRSPDQTLTQREIGRKLYKESIHVLRYNRTLDLHKELQWNHMGKATNFLISCDKHRIEDGIICWQLVLTVVASYTAWNLTTEIPLNQTCIHSVHGDHRCNEMWLLYVIFHLNYLFLETPSG